MLGVICPIRNPVLVLCFVDWHAALSPRYLIVLDLAPHWLFVCVVLLSDFACSC